jgi:hypothetical protein
MKTENALFLVQVTSILMVVIASILNLSFQTGNLQLWTMVLTSSLAYLMPNPRMKVKLIKESNLDPMVSSDGELHGDHAARLERD